MILYKYFPPRRADVLEKQRIRFTPYHEQNDPFECHFIMEPLAHEKEKALNDRYGAEWAETEVWLQSHFSRMGMLCLTKCERNILMWSHYADSHKGFVIGFDTAHDFFNRDTSYMTQPYRVREPLIGPGFSCLRKVRYEKDRFNIHKNISNHWDCFFWKSKHWAYEQEYRVFRSLDEADQKDGNIELFGISPKAIETVVLGAAIESETSQKIQNLLALEEYKHVLLKSACLDRRKFKILIEDNGCVY